MRHLQPSSSPCNALVITRNEQVGGLSLLVGPSCLPSPVQDACLPCPHLERHESATRGYWYSGTEIDDEDQADGGYADADIQGRTPMARFARPEDIARAVAFLADPQQSGYVNGHALSVDGGWFADGSWENLRRAKQGP